MVWAHFLHTLRDEVTNQLGDSDSTGVNKFCSLLEWYGLGIDAESWSTALDWRPLVRITTRDPVTEIAETV